MQKIEGVTGPAIARVTGVEPPVVPPTNNQPNVNPPSSNPPALPQTLLGKLPPKKVKTTGETAKVTFAFSSPTPGARFECSLGRKVKPKGKKARFVGQALERCRAPKTYTLKPGAYRFQVRAVSAAGRDASPARYGFKVVHVEHG
jgi:hypothetical protein